MGGSISCKSSKKRPISPISESGERKEVIASPNKPFYQRIVLFVGPQHLKNERQYINEQLVESFKHFRVLDLEIEKLAAKMTEIQCNNEYAMATVNIKDVVNLCNRLSFIPDLILVATNQFLMFDESHFAGLAAEEVLQAKAIEFGVKFSCDDWDHTLKCGAEYLQKIPIETKAESFKFVFPPIVPKTHNVEAGHPMVVCGPSASGKSTLIKMLMKEFPGVFEFSISHTTRNIRPGEKDEVDYHFSNIEDMRKLIAEGEFLEHAEVHGNLYGTSKKAVEDVRKKGKICILDIDVQGVQNVQKAKLEPTPEFILVAPPSFAEQERRLRNRGSGEDEHTISVRVSNAKNEMRLAQEMEFDHRMVNDDLNKSYESFKQIFLPGLRALENSLQKRGASGSQVREWSVPSTPTTAETVETIQQQKEKKEKEEKYQEPLIEELDTGGSLH
eukprot:TRINITY_DN418_c0_g1_i5.p1 TRINITY_DN418_c0_g1~~TRINITY_DN418_c0_g1_i5.p1  ORF type:complete len:444 (-),score=124.95 TRINITY_DN418_c0_g1_i5:1930-3261(-)